jgi:uncharacterized phiE125 gp8 family phage protein
MSQGLELLTPPVSEPVTLAEAKAHLRVEHSADDGLLGGMIAAARLVIEQQTGRALLPQSWRLWCDAWPAADLLVLPKPPLRSVSAILLYGADDASTVWPSAAYRVESAAQPGQIQLREGQSWPSLSRMRSGLSVSFVAGYADAAAVPETLKLAIKQLVAHWYEQRGEATANVAEIPFGVTALLSPYRQVQL